MTSHFWVIEPIQLHVHVHVTVMQHVHVIIVHCTYMFMYTCTCTLYLHLRHKHCPPLSLARVSVLRSSRACTSCSQTKRVKGLKQEHPTGQNRCEVALGLSGLFALGLLVFLTSLGLLVFLTFAVTFKKPFCKV